MFKVSTKGDYGLLFLSALAERAKAGEHFVSLKEISKEKHLSLSYLSQIVVKLKNAGLLLSREGRDGGYTLARPAQDITMMEILEVLEGPVSPVRCCSNKGAKCGSEPFCQAKFTWHDARALMVQFLKQRTLADTVATRPSTLTPHP